MQHSRNVKKIIYIDTVFISFLLAKIPYSIMRNTTFEPRLGLRFISVFVRSYVDKKTICTIPIVLILATGILPTALAAHTPAYLYGFKLGKNAGLRGYYDVMNDCSNRPYLSTNVTGAIKNFTSLQQVNDCDSGYDHGWNKYCHIGLARHSNAAADCPISGPRTQIKSSQY